MRQHRKKVRAISIFFVILMMMLFGISAMAESLDCVKSYTDNENKTVSIYVKGLESADSVSSAMCGQDSADIEVCEALIDHAELVKTLIMIDNSKSVEGKYRDIITTTVNALIGTKRDNEQMAIVGYSQPKEDNPTPIDIEALAEYTVDEFELTAQLDDIQYGNFETYLTDVLIDYIPKALNEDGFLRIIVLSDGVDNMPEGKSKETLDRLLKEDPVLIHTFACVTSSSRDAEQRQNLNYISELSGGNSFTLDAKDFEKEKLVMPCSMIKNDMSIVRVVLQPQPISMDGGSKAVIIETSEGDVKAKDVEMPQVERQETPEEEPEVVPKEKDPELENRYSDEGSEGHKVKLYLNGKEQKDKAYIEAHVDADKDKICDKCKAQMQISKSVLIGLIACGAGVVILIIVLIIVLIVMKKKNAPVFEPPAPPAPIDERIGNTQFFQRYKLVLEDVMNPARSFYGFINEGNPLLLGRDREKCAICINYETSISSVHCEIGVRGDRFYIRDMQSLNGTYVNDMRITTESILISGNVVTVGKLRFRVNVYLV